MCLVEKKYKEKKFCFYVLHKCIKFLKCNFTNKKKLLQMKMVPLNNVLDLLVLCAQSQKYEQIQQVSIKLNTC